MRRSGEGPSCRPELYGDLVEWYRLLDPVADHADEMAVYRTAFDALVGGARPTLLELGAGAGHNAFHLKSRFRCTLTDLSPAMLELSRELNPTCEHVEGDMRSLRLGRQFDAVLVHDSIVYMTTEDELAAAIATAFEHTRPGGAAIFAPDCTRESFVETTELHEGESDDGERALRCAAWTWDPDPADSVCVVDYAFLLRSGTDLRAVHDRHVEGLFDEPTWRRLLEAAGYRVERLRRPVGEDEEALPYVEQVFVGRRPERA